MTPIKRWLAAIPLALAFCLLSLAPLFLPGCGTTRLELGGAYAQTNQVPDLQFYQIEAAYDLAYSTLDGVFKFEEDNRAGLWKLNPKIKQTLDKIRPQAWDYNVEYLTARAAYKANPVPSGLTTLQTISTKLQQLLLTAQAVLPKGS